VKYVTFDLHKCAIRIITEELRKEKGLHNGLICHASKGTQFPLKFENYQRVAGRVITIL
jgi:hypothetical protein